jgi:hypothetical protein
MLVLRLHPARRNRRADDLINVANCECNHECPMIGDAEIAGNAEIVRLHMSKEVVVERAQSSAGWETKGGGQGSDPEELNTNRPQALRQSIRNG